MLQQMQKIRKIQQMKKILVKPKPKPKPKPKLMLMLMLMLMLRTSKLIKATRQRILSRMNQNRFLPLKVEKMRTLKTMNLKNNLKNNLALILSLRTRKRIRKIPILLHLRSLHLARLKLYNKSCNKLPYCLISPQPLLLLLNTKLLPPVPLITLVHLVTLVTLAILANLMFLMFQMFLMSQVLLKILNTLEILETLEIQEVQETLETPETHLAQ